MTVVVSRFLSKLEALILTEDFRDRCDRGHDATGGVVELLHLQHTPLDVSHSMGVLLRDSDARLFPYYHRAPPAEAVPYEGTKYDRQEAFGMPCVQGQRTRWLDARRVLGA